MESADLKARSPWATLNDIKSVEIRPANEPIDRDITIPGSKSFTNRALIIAALAKGPSTLSGILRSDDSYWCIETLKAMGVAIQLKDNQVHIEGTGGRWPIQKGKLYIGAAGTIARFLPGALAACDQGEWVVEASDRMSERPVKPLIDALTSMGADIRYQSTDGAYPLHIKASGLVGGKVSISGKISSQFISGLLIAAPYARKPVTIRVIDPIVQHAYVHITLDLMKRFGADVSYDQDLTALKVAPLHYKGQTIQLEADASTACYFMALAALTNGKVRINHLTDQTKQPDIKMIDLLERMGCSVVKGRTFIEIKGAKRLKGGFEVSMKEMSDQALTLAAIAPFADGPIKITDIGHIRHHESDRIHVIAQSMTRLGIQAIEHEDGVTIYPGNPKPAVLSSYDDHRVAMSLSLIGTRVPGIKIANPGCVSKTCPNYFDLLRHFGIDCRFEK